MPKQKRSDTLNFYNSKKLPKRPRNQRPELHKPILQTNKQKQMHSSRPFSSTSKGDEEDMSTTQQPPENPRQQTNCLQIPHL